MKGLVAGVVLWGLLALPVHAQQQTDTERFERRMEQVQQQNRVLANPDEPIGERALIDYGAYTTFSYFSIDDLNHNNHGLRQADLVAYGRVNLDGAQELFLRGRITFQDFNHGDSFDGEGNKEHAVVEQAFYRFDLARYLAAYRGIATTDDFAFQGGRQTVLWGNGLVLDQDIDGGVFDLVSGPASLEAIGGQSVPDTVDFDTSRPGFDDRTRRGYFGALFSVQIEKHRPYAYVLAQQDYNPSEVLVTNFGTGATGIPNVSTTRFDYNSYYIGLGSNGSIGDKLVYGVEATYEGGNDLSNSFTKPAGIVQAVPQKREPIQAWAGDVRLDYVVGDPHRVRLGSELILASGDHDRLSSTNTFGGNQPGTRDYAFNGFGLLNTGIAFVPAVSNVAIIRVGGSLAPFPDIPLFRKAELGLDFFVFNKLLQKAPIDEPTKNGRYLGCEPDLFLNWQITSDLTLAMRYGVFLPGRNISSGQFARQTFFTGVTFAF